MFLHRLINGDYPIIHTLSIANEKSLHNEACNVLDGLLKKKKKKTLFWEVSEIHIISLNSGKKSTADSDEICLTIYRGKYLSIESTLERSQGLIYSSRGQEQIIFQNMCSLPACFIAHG